MHSIKQAKGFVVLTSVVLLSIVGIAFTSNMASTQLIDNQVVGNYYRNNEAFVNAESGINLILSKIDESSAILASLPLPYEPADSHFKVLITRLNKNTVEISSLGTSLDNSAQREISLQVYHETAYNIPLAPVGSNGKLNMDSTATINEGCEGVSAANCKSPGNIADYQLVSNPANESQETDLCTGSTLGQNQIDQSALYSDSADNNFLTIGEEISFVDEFGDTVTETVGWPNDVPAGSNFYGVEVEDNLSPTTLFESTFGVSREAGVNTLQASSEVAKIDMNDGVNISCSKRLQALSDEITTIYIKGDCDIDQNDASHSITSENKRFTIGSVDNPKRVFLEGGTFITQPNTGASVIGMLYFLPGLTDKLDADGNPIPDPENEGAYLQVEMQSIDMGGIRVNGAMLTDYNCSHDGYDKTDKNGTKQHFSARYDKTVLNKLYENTGSLAVDSGYSFVAGSWRDF